MSTGAPLEETPSISQAAQRFLDLLRLFPRRGPAPTLAESRAHMDLIVHAATEPPGVRFEPVDVDGVPGEWALPPEAPADRALLYLHGGGYSVGSIASHRRLVGHLALAARTRALSIGYRLAPEHPFPAGLDDAVSSFCWLLRAGFVPSRLGIAGDSAGGGLALATALALARRGLPSPGGLALLSPWTDLVGTGPSITTNRDRDILLRVDGDEPDVAGYAGATVLTDPLVSPLYADFSGFAPFVVHVGGDELLLDDSTRLAERARAAGGDVTLQVWPGMQHVFQIAAGHVPEADASLSGLGRWLAERLGA